MTRADRRLPSHPPSLARSARAVAALAATALIAGCGPVVVHAVAPAPARPASPAPARLHGSAARAAGAIYALSRALRDGDVAALCRPSAIFTPPVVADMNTPGTSCEASDEVSSALSRPPALTVVALAFRPDLAVAQVSAPGGTVPLDVVRYGRRWLVSFSDGNDPLAALAGLSGANA